jgi:hypothetical protein
MEEVAPGTVATPKTCFRSSALEVDAMPTSSSVELFNFVMPLALFYLFY